jgi:hypothetical protein
MESTLMISNSHESTLINQLSWKPSWTEPSWFQSLMNLTLLNNYWVLMNSWLVINYEVLMGPSNHSCTHVFFAII